MLTKRSNPPERGSMRLLKPQNANSINIPTFHLLIRSGRMRNKEGSFLQMHDWVKTMHCLECTELHRAQGQLRHVLHKPISHVP